MRVKSKDGKNHIDGLSEADAKELAEAGDYSIVAEEKPKKGEAAAARPAKTKKPVEPMRLETPKAAARKGKSSKKRGA